MSMNEANEILALRARADALNDEIERRATALQLRAIDGDVEAQEAIVQMIALSLEEIVVG